MLDEGHHEAFVDAWLARCASGLSPEDLLRLFETAFCALWARTETTLGEITLTAIVSRVLHNASETAPFLSSVEIEPEGRFDCHTLLDGIGDVDPIELRDGIRSVLVELLTVLGNLTAEILTPEMHASLSEVGRPTGGRVETKRS